MHKLRQYQQEASDAVVTALKRSTAPVMVEAATGAGKSLIIADIAHRIHKLTGKRILCTAPSAELVVQNAGKYKAIGEPCSLFSASVGVKSTRHAVVFGSPLTVKNRISAFTKGDFALVVVDECDLLTPTLKAIIDAMRETNPNLRVVGLTATPYRLGSGYIFREWPDGRLNGEDAARDPYFAKSVIQIGARFLIDEGYLTRPTIGAINVAGYETHGLLPNKQGKFDTAAVDRAYHGHGRKTSGIVGDIVHQARNRNGVLIYAATIQHAHEVLASLPPELSDIITGETANRKAILTRLRAGKLKYVVNVGVLTVGVDMPHIDVIAILRKTESVRLLLQIIGRGLRLHEGKEDCLILDYTSNLDDHVGDGDLFAPIVKANKLVESAGAADAECPSCGYHNAFSRHKDTLDFALDAHGYCLDVFGARVETDFGPMSGHHGRRCMGVVPLGRVGEYDRCSYRWTSKPCPHCEEPNDIAARYCASCKGEIVDPGDKLKADFVALKRDPSQPQTDRVLSMDIREGVSQKGNRTVRADFKTPWRQFSAWYSPEAKHPVARSDWERFARATNEGALKPETVSYMKSIDTSFFRTLAFNREEDVAP